MKEVVKDLPREHCPPDNEANPAPPPVYKETIPALPKGSLLPSWRTITILVIIVGGGIVFFPLFFYLLRQSQQQQPPIIDDELGKRKTATFKEGTCQVTPFEKPNSLPGIRGIAAGKLGNRDHLVILLDDADLILDDGSKS